MPGYNETLTDRERFVESLRAQVEAGTYRPDAVDIAESMTNHMLHTGCGGLLPQERAFIAETWTRHNHEAAQNVQREQEWRQKLTRMNAAVQDAPLGETFQQQKAREGRFVAALIVGGLALFVIVIAWYSRQGG